MTLQALPCVQRLHLDWLPQWGLGTVSRAGAAGQRPLGRRAPAARPALALGSSGGCRVSPAPCSHDLPSLGPGSSSGSSLPQESGEGGAAGLVSPPPHHPPPPQPDTGSLVPPQLCQAVVSLGTGATAGPLAGPRPAGPGRQLPACPLLPGSICSTDHEASARSCPGQEGHPASGLLRQGAKLFPSWGGWL